MLLLLNQEAGFGDRRKYKYVAQVEKFHKWETATMTMEWRNFPVVDQDNMRLRYW